MSGSRGVCRLGKRWQTRNNIRALLRQDVAKSVHQEAAALKEMLGQLHLEIIAELSKITLRLDNLSSGRVPNTFGSIGCRRNDAGGWEA